MSTLPEPLTVEVLAALMADPTWRDEQGRNLILAVVATQPQDGGLLWHEAETLFLAHAEEAPRPRSDWPLQVIAGSHTKRGAK